MELCIYAVYRLHGEQAYWIVLQAGARVVEKTVALRKTQDNAIRAAPPSH
jgi:hypothetical protein